MVYRYPMRMLNVCTLWWLFGNHIIQKQSFFYLFYLQATGGTSVLFKGITLWSVYWCGPRLSINNSLFVIHCSLQFVFVLRFGVGFFWHQVQFIFKECLLSFELFAPMLFRKHLVKIYLSWINVEFLKVKAKTINNNFFLYIFLSIAIIYFTYVYL